MSSAWSPHSAPHPSTTGLSPSAPRVLIVDDVPDAVESFAPRARLRGGRPVVASESALREAFPGWGSQATDGVTLGSLARDLPQREDPRRDEGGEA
jgi:hypothetical protein